MRTRLSYAWEQLRASYWFIPTAMVAIAVAVSAASASVDRTIDQVWLQPLAGIYPGGPAEASTLLSTIAGSMITVAGVTFSITIVTLSLASSQFGPRLLRSFMRDTGTQVVLGAFVAIFVYSILVFHAIDSTDSRTFVPRISVTIALLMAVGGLGVLIYFIHHVSSSIQAENVIASVGRDLDQAIDALFPGEGGTARPAPVPPGAASAPRGLDRPGHPIPAAQTGYLQAVDDDALMKLARRRDLVLRLLYRPGDFVVGDSDLVIVWPGDAADEEVINRIEEAFIIGAARLRLQDVEFAVDQLVEIAVRALSPGINDPFTAISCVDRLGGSLARLAERDIPPAHRYDEHGSLRMINDAVTFAGIVDAAFNQIRQNGRSSAPISMRLLESIAIIAARAQTSEQRDALRRQADMIWSGCTEVLPMEEDREDLERRYRLVLAALGKHSSPVSATLADSVPQ